MVYTRIKVSCIVSLANFCQTKFSLDNVSNVHSKIKDYIIFYFDKVVVPNDAINFHFLLTSPHSSSPIWVIKKV